MIRVIRQPDVNGQFRYVVPGEFPCRGKASSPLLDACRLVLLLGAPRRAKIGLFREGHDEPDLITTVGYGAARQIAHGGVAFEKYRPGPPRPKRKAKI